MFGKKMTKKLKAQIRDLFHYYFLDLPLWVRLSAAALAGALCGLVLFLIHISNFFSYLSDNPKTCINCHIMVPQYVTWFHSSHREAATCNDCHVPQDNIIKTYGFKAMDGLKHSAIFTIRGEEQAIIIGRMGKGAVQANCQRCHRALFEQASYLPQTLKNFHLRTERTCWECHREVPHGKSRSLSATPFAKAPTTKSMVPEWLTTVLKNEESNKEVKK